MAYALNRAMPVDQMVPFVAMAQSTQASLLKDSPVAVPADPRATLSDYVRTKTLTPEVVPALSALTVSIGEQIKQHGSLAKVPTAAVKLSAESQANLQAFK